MRLSERHRPVHFSDPGRVEIRLRTRSSVLSDDLIRSKNGRGPRVLCKVSWGVGLWVSGWGPGVRRREAVCREVCWSREVAVYINHVTTHIHEYGRQSLRARQRRRVVQKRASPRTGMCQPRSPWRRRVVVFSILVLVRHGARARSVTTPRAAATPRIICLAAAPILVGRREQARHMWPRQLGAVLRRPPAREVGRSALVDLLTARVRSGGRWNAARARWRGECSIGLLPARQEKSSSKTQATSTPRPCCSLEHGSTIGRDRTHRRPLTDSARGGLEWLRVTRRLIWRLHTQRGWWAGMRFENEVERAWARRTGRRQLPRPLRRGGGRHRRSADPADVARASARATPREAQTLPTLDPLQGVASEVAIIIVSCVRQLFF